MAALAASPLWYRKLFYRVEEELRARVEANLAGRFPKFEVRVRAAHLASDGIEVHGLSIAEKGAEGPQGELAYFDVVAIACGTSPHELLSGQPTITALRVRRPVLRATRRRDGTYSLSKLLPLPKTPWPPPKVTVEGGTIEIFDPLKNPTSMLVLGDVNLSIQPAADGNAAHPRLEWQGYLTADPIRRVEFAGTIDPHEGQWTARGKIDHLEISPRLQDALPEPLTARLSAIASLRAPANLTFRVAALGQNTPQFEIDGSVSGGRIEDPMLPYPLTDVTGQFHCDNRGIRIRDVTARDGPTLWHVESFDQQGYAPGSPFVLRGGGRRVHLDPKWATTLPEPWSKYWGFYDPAGDIDVDATIVFDGQRFHPTAEARFLGNVSYSFHKFPYRLERSRGSLAMRDDVLSVAVTGYAGPQPVSINGSFLNPGPKFTGRIEIQADKITLDDKLFAAVLKPESRDTLIALNPSGTFNVLARLRRENPDVPGMLQYARVALDRSNRASITHDKFPYTLSNLEGTIELNAGVWTFQDLAGTNGPGVVKLSGHVSTLPGEAAIDVAIDAAGVPLVEELRNALQPGMRRLWDALRPNGKIDAAARVRFDSRQRQPRVWVRAIPRDDATSIGTSIEPVAFPYRMRLLGGWIDYQDGHGELHNIHAAHGTTQMRTAGSCDIRPDGSWQLALGELSVDRIRLQGQDPELLAALPEALRRAVTELKPGGPMNLRGGVTFAKQRPDAPLDVNWNVALTMHQGSLQAGPKLENIFGTVRLRGSSSGHSYASAGELNLDSLTYKNFQVTQVAGPLWFDNANVFLGSWGPPAAGQSAAPRPRVTARLLGGTLAGDCHVQLGPQPQYRLVASLAQAELAQFARENLAGGQDLRGKVAAQVELHGTRGPRNLAGSGTIHLSEADVYKLPLMISLLKIARAKPPDATAFTQSDIAFEIQQGEHVILKQINLDGDAISLRGHGELTWDGHTNPIRLQLHAAGGGRDFPIVRGMLSEASQQILLIHVGGTLEHPTTRAEPFPVANQALQQLQPKPEKPGLIPQAMRGLGLQR